MRTNNLIIGTIKRKSAQAAKNEVIALSKKEYAALKKQCCPCMVGIDLPNDNRFPDCAKGRTGCDTCWEKALIKVPNVIHELKMTPPYFYLLERGEKTFELRKNDRDFHAGDELVFREWITSVKEYTGEIIGGLVITNVFPDDDRDDELLNKFGIDLNGHVILSFGKIPF